MSRHKLPSGLKIKDLTLGSGRPATRGSIVTFHARITLNHGDIVLDTHHSQPIRAELGKRHLIAGFEYGLAGMQPGGQRELTISPHLAYRDADNIHGIPPHALLRAAIELLDVQHGELLDVQKVELLESQDAS